LDNLNVSGFAICGHDFAGTIHELHLANLQQSFTMELGLFDAPRHTGAAIGE
jgi:hypothetical protein